MRIQVAEFRTGGRHMVIGAAALLVTACASVPEPELTAYVSAFDKARIASAALYGAMEPALSERKQAGTGGAAGSTVQYPSTLRSNWGPPVSECLRFSEDPDLYPRCRAFELAARYNQVLVDLKDGAKTGEVKGEIGQIAGLIGPLEQAFGGISTAVTIMGFAMPAAPLAKIPLEGITTALALATRLESEQQVVEALGDGLPTVRQLVVALQDDLPLMHAILQAYYDIELRKVAQGPYVESFDGVTPRHDLAKGLLGQFETYYKRFRQLRVPNAADATAFSQYSGLKERLDTVLGKITANGDLAKATQASRAERIAASKEYGESNLALYNAKLTDIETSMAEFERISDIWSRHDKSLQAYDRILSGAQSAMDELEQSTQASILPTVLHAFDVLSILAPHKIQSSKLTKIAYDIRANSDLIIELQSAFTKQ